MIDIKSLYENEYNLNEFIFGKTTFRAHGEQQDIDVLFEKHGRRFMIAFQELTVTAISAKDKLFGQIISYIGFEDQLGQHFLVYGCIVKKAF